MSGLVPIYIVARNLLTPLRDMVAYLEQIPHAMPIIIDNCSRWPQLLKWYEENLSAAVIYTGVNGGPQVWAKHLLRRENFNDGYISRYYVVTDSDLDLSDVPLDVLDVLQAGLDRYPDRAKCGLSLDVSGIPDANPFADSIRQWEAQFWTRPIEGRWYDADIDTTFAMRRASDPPAIGTGHSLRAARPYTARHIPWDWTPETMTDEARYYLEHATAAGLMWSARMREANYGR